MSYLRPGLGNTTAANPTELLLWRTALRRYLGGFPSFSGYSTWGYNTHGGVSLGGSGNLEMRTFRLRLSNGQIFWYTDIFFLNYSAVDPASMVWMGDMPNQRPAANQTLYAPLSNGQQMRFDIRSSDGQVTAFRPSGSSSTPVVGRAGFQWQGI